MLTYATLRWSLMSLGCSAIVLFGATPTQQSPPQTAPGQSPPRTAGTPTEPAPDEPPAAVARRSLVKLSEAEVAEALKIMEQLDDNPLVGTLMDRPPPVESPEKLPAQPVDLLREIAGRVDAMANRLESEDLYAAADQLRTTADRLRHQARRIRQSDPPPGAASPVISRRQRRRSPRR